MKKVLVFALMLVCSAAFAADAQLQSNLKQNQFKDLTTELGLAVTPTPNSPAEPLKLLGFDIAVESTITSIKSENGHWQNTWEDGDPDGLLMVNRLHVQKGLPFGLDIGVSLGSGANLEFSTATLEAKYAILKGTAITPAVSVKAAYTKMFGMSDIDMQTLLAGAYISKGVLMFTPYAGVESVYIMAEDSADVDLDKENFNVFRGIVGLQFTPIPLISINAEGAMSGETAQFSLKAGVRF